MMLRPLLNLRRAAPLLGALAVLVFPLGTRAASLLLNPGFESDPAGHNQSLLGWTPYGPNNYNESDPGTAHSGTNYFKVYQGFTSSVNYSGIYQDYISGPGAAYTADGWAYAPASDALAGQNQAWLEITFRDAAGGMLALYRSALITTNTIAGGGFPANQWNHLTVADQYDPGTHQLIGPVNSLVAPANTAYVRCQIVFEGDAANSGGAVYFDDVNLVRTGGAPYGDMNIVWTDEFNGTTINSNVWTYDLGASGWGNNEKEYYTSRTNNAYVAGGCLHIVARKEAYGGASYTSARLKSQGLFDCQYGRIEWRAKLPSGVGFWPALWLLGTNISSVGWPGCGEIDVLENNGSNPFMAQSSIHSGTDATAIYNFMDGDAVTNFHTYTFDWTTNAMLFYVDGHLFERETSWGSSTGQPFPYPYNQPFFLLMNVAVGGNYLGNPSTAAINAGTVFPGEMQVDYVRIYRTTAPLRINIQPTGASLQLSWPSNIICRLLTQTNAADFGSGADWLPVMFATNPMQIPASGDGAFFRLITP